MELCKRSCRIWEMDSVAKLRGEKRLVVLWSEGLVPTSEHWGVFVLEFTLYKGGVYLNIRSFTQLYAAALVVRSYRALLLFDRIAGWSLAALAKLFPLSCFNAPSHPSPNCFRPSSPFLVSLLPLSLIVLSASLQDLIGKAVSFFYLISFSSSRSFCFSFIHLKFVLCMFLKIPVRSKSLL